MIIKKKVVLPFKWFVNRCIIIKSSLCIVCVCVCVRAFGSQFVHHMFIVSTYKWKLIFAVIRTYLEAFQCP